MRRSGGPITTILLWTLLLIALAGVPSFGCNPTIGQRPKTVNPNDPLAWHETGKNGGERQGPTNRVKCNAGQICSESEKTSNAEKQSQEGNEDEDPCDIVETFFGEGNKQSTKNNRGKSQKNRPPNTYLDHSGFKLDESCYPGKASSAVTHTVGQTTELGCVTYDVEVGDVAKVGWALCGSGFVNFQISLLPNKNLKGFELSRIKVKCPPRISPKPLLTFVCSRVNDTDPKDAMQAWRVMRNLRIFIEGAQEYTPKDGYFFYTKGKRMTCLFLDKCRDNLYDCTSQLVRRKGKVWWQVMHPLVMEKEEVPTIGVGKSASGAKVRVPHRYPVEKQINAGGRPATTKYGKPRTGEKKSKGKSGQRRSISSAEKGVLSSTGGLPASSNTKNSMKKVEQVLELRDVPGHDGEYKKKAPATSSDIEELAAKERETSKQNVTVAGDTLHPKRLAKGTSDAAPSVADDKKVRILKNFSALTSESKESIVEAGELTPEIFANRVARNIFAVGADYAQCIKDEGTPKQPMCLRTTPENPALSVSKCVSHFGVNISDVVAQNHGNLKYNRGNDKKKPLTTKLPVDDGICRRGYYLSNMTCIDINECQTDENMCEHFCVNTQGGFKCLCPSGFQVAMDGTSCQDQNECDHFWSNVNCHACKNTLGSYMCICNPGYAPNLDMKSCEDIDECRIHTSGCSQGCVNTIGSFECNCEQGFFFSDDLETCEDLDECRLNISGCAHECINIVGSFECKCREGYYLAEDGRSCLDTNECLRNTSGCAHLCENTMGSFVCKCRRDYFLMENKKQCDHRDECAVDASGKMYARCSHKCTNLPNGFVCSCPEGYSVSKRNPSTCVVLPQDILNSQGEPKVGGLA